MRVKSSRPRACWNSSLNVGLLRAAVIAAYIKNISCPQDMAVLKAFLSYDACTDIWERASSISVQFLERDLSNSSACMSFISPV